MIPLPLKSMHAGMSQVWGPSLKCLEPLRLPSQLFQLLANFYQGASRNQHSSISDSRQTWILTLIRSCSPENCQCLGPAEQNSAKSSRREGRAWLSGTSWQLEALEASPNPHLKLTLVLCLRAQAEAFCGGMLPGEREANCPHVAKASP